MIVRCEPEDQKSTIRTFDKVVAVTITEWDMLMVHPWGVSTTFRFTEPTTVTVMS